MMIASRQGKNTGALLSPQNPYGFKSGARLALSIAALLFVVSGAMAQKPVPSATPALRVTARGEVIVPLVFPVLGGSRWSDTFGKPLHGSNRQQEGQNLPGPKMRPLLACFDGVWTGQGIRGDNGCYAAYGNINNDTPGTDDGLAADEFAFAPGVWPGARVRAGQHIAYCGDSAAEAEKPYLHFELSVNGRGIINPAVSLRAATVLKKPRYTMPRPDIKPAIGQLRVDGEVVSVDIPRGVASVRVAAWIKAKNRVTAQTRPIRRWVRLAAFSLQDKLRRVEQGDFIAVLGKDPGRGQAVVAKEILPLQINTAARQLRAETQKPPMETGEKILVTAGASPLPSPSDGTITEEISLTDEPIATPPPPPIIPTIEVLADFETGYYQGWEVIGNCWGRTIEGVAIAGTTVRGWGGMYFLTTARAMPGGRNIESGTGRARSAPFVIPEDATQIRFSVAGGNYAGRCCLNLLEGEEILRTATSDHPYRMQTKIWDVTELRGKTVRLEIRDTMTVGIHGYIHVDDILLIRGPAENLPVDRPAAPKSGGRAPRSEPVADPIPFAQPPAPGSDPINTVPFPNGGE